MKQTPRDYQQRHLIAVANALALQGLNRVCIESATGTGKGSIIAWLSGDFLRGDQFPILVVAHTETIVTMLYNRIKGILGLDHFEIGIEQASAHARQSSSVIVASIQTLLSEKRLEGWKPKAIIIDEAHHYVAEEWLKALMRFGAFDGSTQIVGMSATMQRTDKKVLFAYNVDGTATLKGEDAVHLDKCIFERCVSRYDIVQAIEEYVLVPVIGYSSKSGLDLSDVPKYKGDFNKKQLAKKVDAPARTKKALEKWEEHAKDRQTIIFCADVDHAYHTAELWCEAGYTAEAADGETDTHERRGILQRFDDGQTQVICNFGLWTEGFDCPACSCIVMLRPTKSEPLYKQMAGRGLRPLDGILNDCCTIEERAEAIARSAKQDCIIIDIVDNNVDGILSAPSLINLPPDIDLQGHSLIDMKKLLTAFQEHAGRIAIERPKTYAELDVVLRRVDLLNGSGAATINDWRATGKGYIFNHLQPGQNAFLDRGEDGKWIFTCRQNGIEKLRRVAPANAPLNRVFDMAKKYIKETFPPVAPKPEVTIVDRLKATGSGGWYRSLRKNGHTDAEINNWKWGYAKHMAQGYCESYFKKKEAQTTAPF